MASSSKAREGSEGVVSPAYETQPGVGDGSLTPMKYLGKSKGHMVTIGISCGLTYRFEAPRSYDIAFVRIRTSEEFIWRNFRTIDIVGENDVVTRGYNVHHLEDQGEKLGVGVHIRSGRCNGTKLGAVALVPLHGGPAPTTTLASKAGANPPWHCPWRHGASPGAVVPSTVPHDAPTLTTTSLLPTVPQRLQGTPAPELGKNPTMHGTGSEVVAYLLLARLASRRPAPTVIKKTASASVCCPKNQARKRSLARYSILLSTLHTCSVLVSMLGALNA
ncbi:hypothetical protein Scep_027788 [Stephania cephalantha]|uniref:Uncharacterized protein n=1 Tax=Stephania cephalantha TaxID=152367 RepID=A0AAP0E8R3_9MAGN